MALLTPLSSLSSTLKSIRQSSSTFTLCWSYIPLSTPSKMSMKRKLSIDFDDEVTYTVRLGRRNAHTPRVLTDGANETSPLFSQQTSKRPNLYAFPTSEVDNDVAMSDASSDTGLLTPLNLTPDRPFHSRLDSNASSISTASSEVSSLQNSPSSSREFLSQSAHALNARAHHRFGISVLPRLRSLPHHRQRPHH